MGDGSCHLALTGTATGWSSRGPHLSRRHGSAGERAGWTPERRRILPGVLARAPREQPDPHSPARFIWTLFIDGGSEATRALRMSTPSAALHVGGRMVSIITRPRAQEEFDQRLIVAKDGATAGAAKSHEPDRAVRPRPLDKAEVIHAHAIIVGGGITGLVATRNSRQGVAVTLVSGGSRLVAATRAVDLPPNTGQRCLTQPVFLGPAR